MDFLQGLASGEIHPSTKNQERFLYEIKNDLENAEGKSSKIWIKYIKLNEMLCEIADLKRMVESKKKKLKS